MLSKLALSLVASSLENDDNSFAPGEIWLDTNGIAINAHGGGILIHGDTYYWYGEIKKGNTYMPECNAEWGGSRVDVTGIGCYSSKDLIHWKNEGNVLPAETIIHGHDLHTSKVLERPKVIFNQKTGKFVMWMHLDSMDYKAARSAVAVSDSPIGPFQYLHSVRPNTGVWPENLPESERHFNNREEPLKRDFYVGQMARDMTLFVEEDGSAYHIYSSEENKTLHISKLSDDYLWPVGEYTRAFVGRSMEAPAIFKRNGKYYLIASGCTGWDPNEARSAVADSLTGPWKELGNPCVGEGKELTFRSQSTFVLNVNGKKEAYIFMADRWNKNDLEDSRYVWLPIEFDLADIPSIKWKDRWNLDELE